MKNVINNLITSLDSIDWCERNIAHQEVEHLLFGVKANFIQFQLEIDNLSEVFIHNLGKNSVETPTHYKWLFYENEKSDYKIWFHQYKSAINKNAGYAVVPHNHRYWFSSFILSGGFTSLTYQVNRLNEDTIENNTLVGEWHLNEGEIYTLSSDTVHSLDDIQKSTWTLIIQSKQVKTFSESFSLETKKIYRHYAFESRIDEFKQRIKSFNIR
jgi:hypothetical protein